MTKEKRKEMIFYLYAKCIDDIWDIADDKVITIISKMFKKIDNLK